MIVYLYKNPNGKFFITSKITNNIVMLVGMIKTDKEVVLSYPIEFFL